MGRRAIRVGRRKRRGLHNALHHPLTRDRVSRQRSSLDTPFGARQPLVRQVRKDTQVDPAARQRLHQRRQRLTGRVDHVGAHRIAAVHQELDDHHGAHFGLPEVADTDVAGAAAQPHQERVLLIRPRHDLSPVRQDHTLGRRGISHIHHLHLADHDRFGRPRLDAATIAQQPGSIAGPGNDGRLFDHHRNQVVTPVNRQIEAHPQRK